MIDGVWSFHLPLMHLQWYATCVRSNLLIQSILIRDK